MKFQNKILDILFKIAETSNGQYKLACAITHRKTILAFGVNSFKTDPFQKKYANKEEKIYRHAEVDAIKRVHNKFGKDILSKSTLYIVRIRRPYKGAKHFVYGISAPCSGCSKAIKEFGIKKVIYTTNYGVEEA